MQKPNFSQKLLAQIAKLTDAGLLQISECRRAQNQVGFGYQFCHAKLFNRFPNQSPFEIVEELATFVAVQLAQAKEQLQAYALQKVDIFSLLRSYCSYLELKKFNQHAEAL